MSASTRSRRRATRSAWASRCRALAAQLELQAVLLQAAGFDRVRVVELGGFEIVARALEVALRDHVDVPGVLGALEFALGGGDLHLGEVAVLAALEDRAPDFDGLAIEGGLGARQAGALALVFIGERGAVDRAEHVAGLDGVAGAHLIDDGAGRFGEQGGAHRRDHECRSRRRRARTVRARPRRCAGARAGLPFSDDSQARALHTTSRSSRRPMPAMTPYRRSRSLRSVRARTARSWDWVPRIETSRRSMVMHG